MHRHIVLEKMAEFAINLLCPADFHPDTAFSRRQTENLVVDIEHQTTHNIGGNDPAEPVNLVTIDIPQ